MNLVTVRPELRHVPLSLIDEPELPSRSAMDEARMDDLEASIRTHGFISVIVLAPRGERYEVIAGHRRTIAARRAGLAEIPALVYPTADAAHVAIQYAENRHREDLNVADEAIWFAQLLEREPELGTDGLAARLGEKRAYVEGRLSLLSGDAEIFRALSDGRIGVGVAQQLNRCDEQLHRRMLLHQAISGGATVALVSGWISEYFQLHKPAQSTAPSSAPAPAPSAIPDTNFFTCALCAKTDNVHTMQPVNIHAYCREALWPDVLAFLKHRSDFVRMPRSQQQAGELINDLAERFGLVPSE